MDAASAGSPGFRPPPPRTWRFDRWGRQGRPILVLNDAVCDRSMWWPLAADLAGDHQVVVADPPGWLLASARTGYDQPAVVGQLAALVQRLRFTRAPIVVGHGAGAVVASVFGISFAAHAIVNIDQPLDTDVPPGLGHQTGVVVGSALLTRLRSLRVPYLSIFGEQPRPGYEQWLRERMPTARCTVYEGCGAFPHLRDPERFAADLRRIGR